MTFDLLFAFADWGMLALRLALAAIFLVHGLPKMKMAVAQQIAAGMGKSPSFIRTLGLAESIGAISLLAGIATQVGALIIGIVMIGALYYKIAKWNMSFTAMDKTGWEFDLLILGAAVAILTIGPGIVSVDAWMWRMF